MHVTGDHLPLAAGENLAGRVWFAAGTVVMAEVLLPDEQHVKEQK